MPKSGTSWNLPKRSHKKFQPSPEKQRLPKPASGRSPAPAGVESVRMLNLGRNNLTSLPTCDLPNLRPAWSVEGGVEGEVECGGRKKDHEAVKWSIKAFLEKVPDCNGWCSVVGGVCACRWVFSGHARDVPVVLAGECSPISLAPAWRVRSKSRFTSQCRSAAVRRRPTWC